MSTLSCFKYEEKFGRLSIIEEIPKIKNRRAFLCKCDCGTYKEVLGIYLRSGDVKSCGCLSIDTLIDRNYKHGGRFHKAYTNWKCMNSRCYDILSTSYSNYGGRGIFVCRRWRNNFWRFVEDIGEKPSENHTIDRIDNNGPYAPWNCRWATRKEQARNKTNNKNIYYNGMTKCLTDWSKDSGIPKETLRTRIKRYGSAFAFEGYIAYKECNINFNNETKPLTEWSKLLNIPYGTLYDRLYNQGLSIKEAFNDSKRFKFLKLEYQGKEMSLTEWSKYLDKKYDTLRYRLNKGMSIEDAFKK